ncbi:hypothetical protein PHYBLDRAFT_138709 [Phycomyces blakesleeanus NRRL 1555(-)]|uniref:Uncharacterized protein n=1 Tax=Phycomyces blakesleeanus (strain ATCC 8743b / DSM 1359 / FGSC 10004 / NBRC 33097 / NRRL 1555) TaxID=763407 RepID=A0A167R9H9_PHYB8|nr:hypothetical protein PHYBLDRAFT_138709 [Phycomyces blakesleeanus NRRL 1555(-)]OAD81167.1 hypothetical protein PHYBLDRAFT_138709 [Phycomyces blakesleeanus NRRL 1555(-)]|eukprot:XP_018299207.1 hypothetical protein PHYBLDRAFT_138709 [Phycomyces blakesleeanus NRRL 1555(-)]
MSASTNLLIIHLKDKRLLLPQQHWFGTIDHPQLVAGAFNRSVVVYWNTSRETGDCLFGSIWTVWRDCLKGQPESVLCHLVTYLGKCHIGRTAWAAWAAWAVWKYVTKLTSRI